MYFTVSSVSTKIASQTYADDSGQESDNVQTLKKYTLAKAVKVSDVSKSGTRLLSQGSFAVVIA